MTDHANPENAAPRDDHWQRHLENQKKLAAWEQQKKREAEEAERAGKQAELERYLQRRGKEWHDTTGSQPPADLLSRWQQEFVDQKEEEYQKKRAAKLAEAYAEYPESFKQ